MSSQPPDPNIQLVRTIYAGERLFDSINDLHTLIAAMAIAVHALTRLDDRRFLQDDFGADLNCHSLDFAFLIGLRGPMESLILDKPPQWMEIRTRNRNDLHLIPKDGKPPPMTTGRRMYGHIAGGCFLLFFDRYDAWLDKTLGKAVNWPATLNFARFVRNAAAHGAVHVKNPNAPLVEWRGLKFGYANNGNVLLGWELGIGDILALMLDVDKELDLLGAPIL